MVLTGHSDFLMQTAGLNFNDKFDILLKMRSNPGAGIAQQEYKKLNGNVGL